MERERARPCVWMLLLCVVGRETTTTKGISKNVRHTPMNDEQTYGERGWWGMWMGREKEAKFIAGQERIYTLD